MYIYYVHLLIKLHKCKMNVLSINKLRSLNSISYDETVILPLIYLIQYECRKIRKKLERNADIYIIHRYLERNTYPIISNKFCLIFLLVLNNNIQSPIYIGLFSTLLIFIAQLFIFLLKFSEFFYFVIEFSQNNKTTFNLSLSY